MTMHVVLCGHGTRVAEGAAEFVAVADAVRERVSPVPVSHAFLELSKPLLTEELDRLYGQGARSILVMPALLFSAGHVKSDIPSLMHEWQAAHTSAELRYGCALGIIPSMVNAAKDRIEQALTRTSADIPRGDTVLLLIGRGSSDPDATADFVKLMKLLWQEMGFARGEVGYCDVAVPDVAEALDRAARPRVRRVVVAPYLLFTGVLTRRLNELVTAAAHRHPAVEFVTGGSLNNHDGVIASFAERIAEVLAGQAAGNCPMCTPIPASEAGP